MFEDRDAGVRRQNQRPCHQHHCRRNLDIEAGGFVAGEPSQERNGTQSVQYAGLSCLQTEAEYSLVKCQFE